MGYVLRRLAFYVAAFWAALTVNFFLPRVMPGNPAEAVLARARGTLQPQAIHALEVAFGIGQHESWMTQYVQYLEAMLTGRFGTSFTYFPTPVATVIGNALPWTLFLVGISSILSFFLGTYLGIWSAWRRGRTLDSVLPTAFTFVQAMPYFWVALLTLYIFGFLLHWFPIASAYSTELGLHFNLSGILDILYHAVLPSFTIVFTSLGGWVVGMRNNMISTLSEDYILMAQMKGLPENQIVYQYAARNALLPQLTGFAISLGFVVGGAILTEIVFSYPGIGYTLYQAVANTDYPLMQAIFLLISTAVLLANFLADMLYGRLDPRVREGGR